MPAKPGGRRMKTITNHVGILIVSYENCLIVIDAIDQSNCIIITSVSGVKSS